MKYYKSKISKFLNGKGFYLVLGLCMIAVGFAAYSAMDAAKLDDTKDNINSQSTEQNISDEVFIPNTVIDEQASQTQNSEVISEADTKTQAEYFYSPIKNGSVAKGFDNKTLQYSATYNDFRLHSGVDVYPTDNISVLSCGAGTVAAIDKDTSLGNVITIDHGNGIFIRYCGVNGITVNVGDILNAGDALGEIGEIKGEIGDELHLHLEIIKDSEHIDPTSIIAF